MKILVVLGSIREGRVGDKLANWVMEQAQKRNPDFKYELLDLKDYPMKLFQEEKHPAMLNGQSSDENANKWIKKVKEADGFLLITPEYNRGTSSALKNAIDYPYNEWHKKPMTFVGYGGVAGGSRAIEQLRLNAIELQSVVIREGLLVSFIHSKIKDGKIELDEYYVKQLSVTLDQLEWYTQVLKKARES
jgi:NAD(P)H-dependent FMN reductase